MTNPVAAAFGWIEDTLLGTVATAVAVIAVAWIGFLLLSGHLDVRRLAHVILGCFIVFGASTIASGIQYAIMGGDSADYGDSALIHAQAVRDQHQLDKQPP